MQPHNLESSDFKYPWHPARSDIYKNKRAKHHRHCPLGSVPFLVSFCLTLSVDEFVIQLADLHVPRQYHVRDNWPGLVYKRRGWNAMFVMRPSSISTPTHGAFHFAGQTYQRLRQICNADCMSSLIRKCQWNPSSFHLLLPPYQTRLVRYQPPLQGIDVMTKWVSPSHLWNLMSYWLILGWFS